MNRSYIAGCCVIVAAAALGFWIFAEKLPSHRPPRPTLAQSAESTAGEQSDQVPVYGARLSGDIIDLSRAYDPTGEELDLHNLLHGQLVAELIVAPREAQPEPAPAPRECERELLHAPQLAAGNLPEAGEEASSPPNKTQSLFEPFAWVVASYFADWFWQSLPFKEIAPLDRDVEE